MAASDQVREYTLPGDAQEIVAVLSWDYFGGHKADLDVSVMAFDTYSLEREVAFYNNTSICNGAVVHSGDQTGGSSDGNSESIRIALHMLPAEIRCLFFVVNCHNKGGTFSAVETGELKLLLNGEQCYSYFLSTGFDATALSVGALFRDETTAAFKFTVVEDTGTGVNFDESRYLVERHLDKVFDSVLLMERPRHPGTCYTLQKGERYNFSSTVSYVKVGLGWDPDDSGGSVDVDGSIALFGDEKQHIADVYFTKQEYEYSGMPVVKHSGDNLTGEGQGDDEQIHVFLGMMDPKVAYIAVAVNIYSGAESFGSIRRCFVRLVHENGHELCRYELGESVAGTGLIMGFFFHNEKREWRFLPVAKGCVGKKITEITSDIQSVLDGSETLEPEFATVKADSRERDALFAKIEAPTGISSAEEETTQPTHDAGAGNGGCCVIL